MSGEAVTHPPTTQPSRRHFRWRRLLIAGFVLALVAGTVAWNVRDNFGTVIPGQVYRSGQLGLSSFTTYIQRYHFQCIVNLRGSNPDLPWYQDERAAAEKCGVQHHDLPTDSGCLKPEELRDLVQFLDTCAKPVLLHCESGIDRSGLAAVVAILLLQEDSEALARARGQLGWHHGHVPWRPNHARHHAFLDLYEHWLVEHGYTHRRQHFREWALHTYTEAPE
jgi:protein tyrosine phosphatase (PTP) superfamily phosphohydrolase (DUF442 family)